jgi:hypothetical protein
MTALSSNNLREQVLSAGIEYFPADKTFYTDFQYKVELRPKFKGLGSVGGKRGCYIDISNPVKARTQLATFNTQMDRILSNAEHRQAICAYVDSLPSVSYKSRIGGENNLFYFRDSSAVMALVEQYGADITSVTGPISDEHAAAISKYSTVVRKTLYFNKFRYYIELSTSFLDSDITDHVVDFISNLPCETYRTINYRAALQPGKRYRRRANNVVLYLVDGEDYVYMKLLAGEHIKTSHEVILFSDVIGV